MLMFGVLHFGDHNLHGGVALYRSEEAYRELSKAARDALSRSDLPAAIHALDQGFPGHTYSLKNLFRDEQRKVLTEVLESTVDHSFSVARAIYEEQAQLLRFMSDCGIPIPKELKAAAEVALNGLLRQALGAPELDQTAIQNLLEEMRVAAIPLDEGGLEIVLRRNLERGADQFFEDPRDLARLEKFRDNLVVAESLPFAIGAVVGTEPLLRSAAKTARKRNAGNRCGMGGAVPGIGWIAFVACCGSGSVMEV